MTVSPARRAALRVITRVRRDDAFSGPVLAAELASAALGPEDAALATRIAYGTLATAGVLDEVIDRYARGGLEPRVRDSLRAGAYELLFARTPAYAVVDQTVAAVRALRPAAAGLANAVMRRIAEAAPGFPFGDPATDDDALARATGHPRWIVEAFVTALGRDAAREALAAGLEPAPTFVRLDPFAAPVAETRRALDDLGAAPTPVPPDVDCYALGRASAVYRTAAPFGFFPMDAAAQFAPAVVAPAPGALVADIGAGRGNKTLCLQAIAARQGGFARISAIDLHAGKTASLRERLDASSVPGVTAITADAHDLSSVDGFGAFEAVLLDVPCTGLGTLRRYPEKRWRLAPGDVTRMAALQRELLGEALRAVRPGGRVVYSTCSVAAAENGDVVRDALGGPAGREFVLEALGGEIPTEWARFANAEGCFQSWPTMGGPDGHFVARLRRRDESVGA